MIQKSLVTATLLKRKRTAFLKGSAFHRVVDPVTGLDTDKIKGLVHRHYGDKYKWWHRVTDKLISVPSPLRAAASLKLTSATKAIMEELAMVFTSTNGAWEEWLCVQVGCGKAHGVSFAKAAEHAASVMHCTERLKARSTMRQSKGKMNLLVVKKEFGMENQRMLEAWAGFDLRDDIRALNPGERQYTFKARPSGTRGKSPYENQQGMEGIREANFGVLVKEGPGGGGERTVKSKETVRTELGGVATARWALMAYVAMSEEWKAMVMASRTAEAVAAVAEVVRTYLRRHMSTCTGGWRGYKTASTWRYQALGAEKAESKTGWEVEQAKVCFNRKVMFKGKSPYENQQGMEGIREANFGVLMEEGPGGGERTVKSKETVRTEQGGVATARWALMAYVAMSEEWKAMVMASRTAEAVAAVAEVVRTYLRRHMSTCTGGWRGYKTASTWRYQALGAEKAGSWKSGAD
ncbi:unnamed protein product [Closterium sp. NIES-64]|nr:unnamed protein product [Closterium sp. NIES-64]